MEGNLNKANCAVRCKAHPFVEMTSKPSTYEENYEDKKNSKTRLGRIICFQRNIYQSVSSFKYHSHLT